MACLGSGLKSPASGTALPAGLACFDLNLPKNPGIPQALPQVPVSTDMHPKQAQRFFGAEAVLGVAELAVHAHLGVVTKDVLH